MSAAHSPTPWRTNVARRSDGQIIVVHVVTSDGTSVAQMAGHPNETANAAFIVRAANCHDDLVTTLRQSRKTFEALQLWNCVSTIDAALAKAEGRS